MNGKTWKLTLMEEVALLRQTRDALAISIKDLWKKSREAQIEFTGLTQELSGVKKRAEREIEICKELSNNLDEIKKSIKKGFCSVCEIKFYGKIKNAQPSKENPNICESCYKKSI